MATLELCDVAVEYPGTPPVAALRGVDLRVEEGEFVAIVGPSGGGKSTVLNVLGLLHAPTRGRYLLDGEDVAGLRPAQMARVRAGVFGYIFQGFHLLDKRPVLDSVGLGMFYQGVPKSQRDVRSLLALDRVGLAAKATQRAGTLSGGERQRVAIARALACGDPVLLADEPTGNLDSVNGRLVIEAIRLVHESGVTVVLVTHDPVIAGMADRQIHIRDGRVAHE
jgi:macrolide transport system ATP-binding/permease protein